MALAIFFSMRLLFHECNNYWRSVLIGLLVFFLNGCAPKVDAAAERAAVHKFHDTCMDAARARDLAVWVSCFAEDAQLFPPNAPTIKGKDAIGEVASQIMESPDFSVSHEIVRTGVSRSGDFAYIYYTYELTENGPNGNPVTENGEAIYVLKNQPQAGWKFLIDIWNAAPRAVDAGSENSASYKADVQAILDLEQRVFDAQIAGDIDAWLSSFADDAIVMVPNQHALTNKLAIRQWNAPIFEQFDLHEESDEREVEVAGDWAYIRAHWIWTQTPKSGGNSAKYTGYSIWIVRRQPNGSWKITRGIFNYENPIPGAG